jgi:hypothetical protein
MITPNLDSIQANEPSDYSDSLAQRENESFALASKRMDLESGWVGLGNCGEMTAMLQ